MSPDGGKVAFVSKRDEPNPENCENSGDCNWELYVVNIDGTGLTQLTNNQGWDYWPAWSPDGSQIAFWYSDGEQWDIIVMNSDGSDLTNLTNDEGMDLYPTWKPDGSQVVFFSARDNGFQFWVVNADGTDLTMLESGLPLSVESESRVKIVAFTGRYNFYLSTGDIFDAKGFKEREESLGEFPSWSPDGTRITFHSERHGNREIYVMNADLSNLKRLTNNEAEDSFPVWSPDGSQIAFQSNRDGNFEIYVMNAGGSDLRNLTNNSADDTLPTWYP